MTLVKMEGTKKEETNMILSTNTEQDFARENLIGHSHVLFSIYENYKPDDNFFLREHPEVVDQMEEIDKLMALSNRSDIQLILMMEKLLYFLQDWFPDDEDDQDDMQKDMSKAEESLNAFRKIHDEVRKMSAVKTQQEKEKMTKSMDVILYNLQSGAYQRLSFEKATRQDGYVYQDSHVDLDEDVTVRILTDRVVVFLWQLDHGNEFGNECEEKRVDHNGKEIVLKKVSYEIMITDIYSVSDAGNRVYPIKE